MHVRVMLMIWEFLAAHFVNDAGLLDFRSRGLSTAKVGSCCVISFHREFSGARVDHCENGLLHDFSPPRGHSITTYFLRHSS